MSLLQAMCGRFSQTQSGEAIADAFQLSTPPAVTPRYNIAPTQRVTVITQPWQKPERVHHQKHWGLIPGWAKDASQGSRLINARAETVAHKPTFRKAFQRRRCLVIADGFYEWQQSSGGGSKQPFLIQLASKQLFAFAGLWERWQEPNTREQIFSCTILTTQPNSLMAPIHNRMPVILGPEAYDAWLDPSFYNPGMLESLLRPYASEAMITTPISTAINNPQNDSESVQHRTED